MPQHLKRSIQLTGEVRVSSTTQTFGRASSRRRLERLHPAYQYSLVGCCSSCSCTFYLRQMPVQVSVESDSTETWVPVTPGQQPVADLIQAHLHDFLPRPCSTGVRRTRAQAVIHKPKGCSKLNRWVWQLLNCPGCQ